eukprot:6500656-Pyramimonas_sp.AAC.1
MAAVFELLVLPLTISCVRIAARLPDSSSEYNSYPSCALTTRAKKLGNIFGVVCTEHFGKCQRFQERHHRNETANIPSGVRALLLVQSMDESVSCPSQPCG